ncbi:hypothetical protein WDV92_08185 [Pseudomonas syringae pv. atrofaciens]
MMALSLRGDTFGHEKSTGRQKLEWEFEQSASERGVHQYTYFFIITRQRYSNMALFWSAVRRQGKIIVIAQSGRTSRMRFGTLPALSHYLPVY